MKHLLILFLFVGFGSIALGQDKIDSAKPQTESTNLVTNKPAPQKPKSVLHVPVVYTFIGNGNWSDPANWDANGVPPDETNPDSKIYINNAPGGKCYLDVPYVVKSGTLPTSLIIFTGSNLVIPQNLIVK